MSFLWFLHTFQSPQNISGIKSSQFWSFTEDIYLSPWKIFQTTIITGFPDSSVGKESACSAGDPGSIPGSRWYTGEGIGYQLQYSWASLVAQLVNNLPAMLETWVQTLGLEDTLEKGKATHSSILIWWESGTMYSPWGCKESDTTEWLSQPLLSNTCHYKNKKIKNKKTSGFFVKKTALMYAQIDSRCLRFSC